MTFRHSQTRRGPHPPCSGASLFLFNSIVIFIGLQSFFFPWGTCCVHIPQLKLIFIPTTIQEVFKVCRLVESGLDWSEGSNEKISSGLCLCCFQNYHLMIFSEFIHLFQLENELQIKHNPFFYLACMQSTNSPSFQLFPCRPMDKEGNINQDWFIQIKPLLTATETIASSPKRHSCILIILLHGSSCFSFCWTPPLAPIQAVASSLESHSCIWILLYWGVHLGSLSPKCHQFVSASSFSNSFSRFLIAFFFFFFIIMPISQKLLLS